MGNDINTAGSRGGVAHQQLAHDRGRVSADALAEAVEVLKVQLRK